MRGVSILFLAVSLTGPLPFLAQAEYVQEPDPLGMWECRQAGDVPLYTNREREGCRKMELKALSTVSELPNLPARAPRNDRPIEFPQKEPMPPAQSRDVPTWAQDWYAANSSSAPVQTEVCQLYSEWLQLMQRTRGGFYFGSDPSYGADPSRRNYWTNTPFWDNARYVTLANIFGRGFVPIGCL